LSLRAGDEIGDWAVEDILGEGSMGVVYRCRNLRDPATPAAVKVSKSRLSPRAMRRFVREADLLAELDHEAIIRVRNKGEDAARGLSWFAMELLEGLTFRERIQRVPPLPVGVALSLFARISDGLAYAHERNIFHRDLKPSNLFLCLNGSVRILDFGVGLAVEWSPLTATDQQMGTYAYMPPEVFHGQTVDPALGDIYGLGLVLYEVLLGEEVFLQPLNQMTTMKLNAVPMDPGDAYPRELRDLLLQATDPRPERRLLSMQTFADRVLELSLEFPSEGDDQVFTEALRAEVEARSLEPTQATFISNKRVISPGPVSTGVHPQPATRIVTDPSEAPPDHWMLKGRSAPLSRDRIVELISAENLSGNTLVARPGGSWRELRYHPTFRAYFAAKPAPHRAPQSSAPPLDIPRQPRRLWPLLLGAMTLTLGGVYAISHIPTTPRPPQQASPIRETSASRAALTEKLAALGSTTDGDLSTLQDDGQALLRDYTRAGARAALEKLSAAGQRDMEHIATFAGIAEAAARLEDTDDLAGLADLSLVHARHLSNTSPAVARAILIVERLRGNHSAAIGAAPLCTESPDCALLLAAAASDLDALRTLTAAHPDRPGMGLVRLAVLLEARQWGEIQDAAIALQTALPDEPLPHRAMAVVSATLGDYESARVAAERAAVLEPGWLDMTHLRGQVAHRVHNRPAEGLATLTALTTTPGFSSYPDQPGVWRDLAAAALAAEEPDQAIQAAATATQLDPTDPISRLQHAWALHERGDRAGFRSEVGTINLSGLTGRSRAAAGLTAAKMLAAAGLNRQAILELKGALEADPSFTPAWVALAGVQAGLDDSHQVVLALEAAALRDSALLRDTDPLDPIWSPPVDLTPTPEQLRTLIARDLTLTAQEDALMGILHWLRGDPREARPLLAAAIHGGSRSAAVHAAMGQLLLYRQQHADALTPLAIAAELSPDQALLVAMHSHVLAVLGEKRQASVQLAGLADHLDNAPFVLWKARALAAAGETDTARSLLTRHLRDQQRAPTAWALLLSL
jgi:serine/threonine protein kinase/tetratricopeptide (TPR) repeat protein